MTQRRRELVVAVAQLVVGALVLIGVFALLPARYLPVDVVGALVGGACVVAGVGLIRGAAWGRSFARAVSIGTLCVGLAAASALSVSLAHLAGNYGPVGGGGAVLMGVIALLLLPYLVGLPILQLVWLSREGHDGQRDG